MKTTPYFRRSVMARRPYLREEWIVDAVERPLKKQRQSNGRIRCWTYVSEYDKYLRVVLEPDKETVHNAFFDRGFAP